MQTVGNLAESLISKSNPAFAEIFVDWRKIVGDSIAEAVDPHKIVKMNDSNVLVLKVKSGCAIEIQHDSLQILNSLNSYFGEKIFSVVRVFSE